MNIDLITPKYCTSDLFKLYTGIELDYELKKSDDPSNDANRNIKRVEDKCIDYLIRNYSFKTELLEHEYALTKFIEGVCEQLKEELRSGENISVCPSALAKFRAGGLANIRRG